MSDPNDQDPQSKKLTGRETYNLITDTVAGPNLRWKDNLFQGLAILVSIGLGVLIGWLVAADPKIGALAGGFIGLVAGTLISGLFLMIFRGVRHAQGKHD
jgi:hypothetical protein